MTQSSTDSSSMYDPYWYASGETMTTTVEDMVDSMFSLDLPTALPLIYVQKLMPQVIKPHIETRFDRFCGNKFKIGGSKK